MKRIGILLISILQCCWGFAQTYNSQNSLNRVALVYFFQDEKGFFQKKENFNLQEVLSVVSSYGYDKKSHELYVETDRANCVVTVTDDLHKVLKKSKSIPQLKSDELSIKAQAVSKELEDKFERLNQSRQRHIADSIERVHQDSIRQAREDSIRIAEAKAKAARYLENNRWFRVPTKNQQLYCTFCEKNIKEDTLSIYGINNDSIFWFDLKWGYLVNPYDHVHAAKVPLSLKQNKDYAYHCEVFADTIKAKSAGFSTGTAALLNANSFLKYLSDLQKDAPNGFFLDWGWDDEYSTITFNFKYMNTNKNTIKYIEVFFVVTNDVGDVRKTGSFKGTGPLEQWESASWNWDHSRYYVAGDASKMNISKVIITYMNGSKVTIPKNKLRFDHSID